MLAALASLSLVLASIAGMAPGDGVKPDESHCVVFVVDKEPDGKLVTTDPVCFPVKVEAEVWADTGLSLSSVSLPTLSAEGIVALASFTLGTHYGGANGTGSSISVVWRNSASLWLNWWSSQHLPDRRSTPTRCHQPQWPSVLLAR
jgi:hypothetical protein